MYKIKSVNVLTTICISTKKDTKINKVMAVFAAWELKPFGNKTK